MEKNFTDPVDDEVDALFDALIKENDKPIPHPDGPYDAEKTAAEIQDIIDTIDAKYDRGEEGASDIIYDG